MPNLTPLAGDLEGTGDRELLSRLISSSPDEKLLAECRGANESLRKSFHLIDDWEAYCRTVYPELVSP